MFISRLSLTDFRSYAEALIAPGSGLVVLTGENGAGKTNILEAVSLLSPGRGLRGASLSEMARKEGPGGFAVAARLASPPLSFKGGGRVASEASADSYNGSVPPSRQTEGPFTHAAGPRVRPGNEPVAASFPKREWSEESIDVGTGTTAAAPERRQVRVNGAPASATSLAEWLSVLWLTPAMDRLFNEAASGRRRFFDRLVLALEPSHATHSARYEAAMRARNKLLAEPDTADPAWLAALEAGMAEHGARVAEARMRTLAALSEQLAAQPEGPFARAALAFDRWVPAADDAEGELRNRLRHGRGGDAAAGRTLVGPHRTDLLVTHVAKGEPAEHCSTGEQKALLLSITLAHAELTAQRTAKPPVLLLDEVAAHLDPRRRAALFERLSDRGGQVWMTGTERSLFEAAGGGEVTWLHVADGQVRAE